MKRTVLVVDDEYSVCRELRKFLEGKGYDVVEASSGDEGIEVYRQERPDVVLLDMMMPHMSGLAALQELRALDPEACVIVVTALYEEVLANQAMDEGAFDYITKPINREHLEMALMTKLAPLGKDD
ncbi:MAG: response regulator [bacterium]|nr:response regulator [bacterium]